MCGLWEIFSVVYKIVGIKSDWVQFKQPFLGFHSTVSMKRGKFEPQLLMASIMCAVAELLVYVIVNEEATGTY